jgi:LDH2 family malate/lactate/ureidoglycolate dehydrogenase
MGSAVECRGQAAPCKWLLDADGNPTDEPGALFGNPAGAMLPLIVMYSFGPQPRSAACKIATHSLNNIRIPIFSSSGTMRMES